VEAALSSETSMNFYETTWSHIPKDSYLLIIHEFLEELRKPKETSVRIAGLWT
jgi:hypothetical protein